MNISQRNFNETHFHFEDTAKKLMKEGFTYIDCIRIRAWLFDEFVECYPSWMEIETKDIAKGIHEGSLKIETQKKPTLPDQERH